MSFSRPAYLVHAASRKYETSSQNILSVSDSDLNFFWSEGSQFALQIDPPREVARYVVDVEIKEVINESKMQKEVEITTLKSSAVAQPKTYRLFGSTRPDMLGLSTDITSEFFQMVPIKLTKGFRQDSAVLRFSKDYGVVGKMTLPPVSKVTATITTQSIAFQSHAKVRVRFPIGAGIFFRRVTRCCFCKREVGSFLSARELLEYNDINVQVDGQYIFFDDDRTLSYMGESTEMRVGEPVPLI